MEEAATEGRDLHEREEGKDGKEEMCGQFHDHHLK